MEYILAGDWVEVVERPAYTIYFAILFPIRISDRIWYIIDFNPELQTLLTVVVAVEMFRP